MEYNIILEYVKFLKKNYLELFKIIFKDDYKKNLCSPLVDRYLEVRYYNDTNHNKEKEFIKRVNKDLIDVYEELVTEDNADYLKSVVALFGYIVYFDDVFPLEKDLELINNLSNEEYIKCSDRELLKKDLKAWYINFKKSKEKFNDVIQTKYFNVVEEKIGKNLYYLVLEHNVKISNLYSEYAIDKVYNNGIISEDKLFITYIIASYLVLNNAINLDFSRKYMVSIVSTLFEKEKKFTRLINIFDNPISKSNIFIRIKYEDYKKNKSTVDKLINDGYSFGLELDDNSTFNINELVLFPYVLASKDTDVYEMLLSKKNILKSKLIKL